jgi:hypothetical protein
MPALVFLLLYNIFILFCLPPRPLPPIFGPNIGYLGYIKICKFCYKLFYIYVFIFIDSFIRFNYIYFYLLNCAIR